MSFRDEPGWHPRRHRGELRRRYAMQGPPRRDPEGRLLGGVAAGFARWREWNPTTVRLVFVLVTVFYGLGIPLYIAAWLLIPAQGQEHNVWHKAKSDSLGIALAAASATAFLLFLLVLGAINDGWIISWLWPQIASAAGLVLIWRDAEPAEKASLHRLVEPLGSGAVRPGRDRRTVLRISLSVLLLVSGLAWLLSQHANVALLSPLGGVILMLGGAVLLLAPWWLRIARDLVIERQARARAEERTEIASRVHDSVLQTLALIQRRADDPQQVITLARSQERELRSWLFEGKDPAAPASTSFTSSVAGIQADVEDRYGVSVEVVTVGDCDLDEDLVALVSAAREATVNAAKWSGVTVVSVFGEVEAGKVTIVVRDKGKGFDSATVPSDRKGLAESVHGRMTRHGGTASVQSAPGEGTKVTISVPRHGGKA